jgi:antitoxin StbD
MPVAIVSQNRIMAYLVSAELYEQMLNRLDDFELAGVVLACASEKVIAMQMEEL